MAVVSQGRDGLRIAKSASILTKTRASCSVFAAKIDP